MTGWFIAGLLMTAANGMVLFSFVEKRATGPAMLGAFSLGVTALFTFAAALGRLP